MRIHRIKGLMASCYLLEGDDLYLVDAGYVGHHRAVLRTLREIGRSPDELRLVVVTHGHLDHFGGLAALRDLAHFEVIAHPHAAPVVSCGGKTFAPGRTPWAKSVAWIAGASLPHLRYRGAGPVLPVDDGAGLHHLGLPGRIIHTPGHTDGCLTLLLDDGTAFTGDLVSPSMDPQRPGLLPNMAVSHTRAVRSWRRLLEIGARRILPGHGPALSADQLAVALAAADDAVAA